MINGRMLIEKRFKKDQTNWHWSRDQRPMMVNSNPYWPIAFLERDNIVWKIPNENKPPSEFSPEKPLAAN